MLGFISEGVPLLTSAMSDALGNKITSTRPLLWPVLGFSQIAASCDLAGELGLRTASDAFGRTGEPGAGPKYTDVIEEKTQLRHREVQPSTV
jgi:hypothetical protein